MVTPFDARGRVDEDAAVRLMHHLLEHGSDGLVVCGTTGEASTLTDEEQPRVIELAVREMKPAHPGCTIVAGAGSNDTRHAVELTEKVTELGVDALLSVNPYYNRPSRRGIVRHYEEIDRATDRPILLYNIPPADRHPHAQRPARRARAARTRRRRQAVQQRTSWRRSTACRSTPATTTSSPTTLDLGEPGGILVSAPPGRRRPAPDGRRTRAARRRSTPACRTCTATSASRRSPARRRRR